MIENNSAKVKFLSAIQTLISHTEQFRKETKNILVDHRKEVILDPNLEKTLEKAVIFEYIPSSIQKFFDTNFRYLLTDKQLLQTILDRYSLGKVHKYSSNCNNKMYAPKGILCTYDVYTNKGNYLLIETTANKTDKELVELSKLFHLNDNFQIGVEHRYDKYYYIYSLNK
ncbi:MAG: hypothetical protein ABIH84_02150 [bacterium]